MAVDLLVQGREPERPRRRPGLRRATRLAMLLAVAVAAAVATGAVQLKNDDTEAEGGPAQTALPRPLPRVLMTGASVIATRPATDDALRLDVRIDGLAEAQLLSVQVELPGSAVVLGRVPDRMSPAGEAVIRMNVLPRCPQAALGLTQAAVVAAVRGRPAAAVRVVRVRLDTAGVLADTVHDRCGPVPGAAEVRTSLVELAEPTVPGTLPTEVEVGPAGSEAVTVVAVRPGPGLAVDVRTPLPLLVLPAQAPTPLHVDLHPGGCGGAPDTPPYVLVLGSGQTVAPSVGSSLRQPLDALRPYVCPG